MNLILNTILNVLTKSSTLKYVKSISACEDITTIVEKGKFPLINIDGDSKSYDDITDWSPNDAQRIAYKIIIQCAVKNTEKKIAVLGKSPDNKGIFELADDIYNVIVDYCQSIEDTSTELKISKKPTMLQRTWVMQDSQYMAGIEMTIELIEDVFE